MLNLKKLAALAMSLAMLTVSFTGCSEESEAEKNSTAASEFVELEDLPKPSKETGKVANFTAPEKGEEIIVMKIKDYGDIKIKLFNEQAPAGSKNFSYHASTGYYDGLIFHRIINNFMIQGGDPMGVGIGGESIWGEKFDGGTHSDLVHVPGAVCYANSGHTSTNGSQFYIVTGDTVDENMIAQYQAAGYPISEDAGKIYAEIGKGTPFLDGSYTVFGQVFDGLDIVYELQGVETDSGDKPLTDVVMEEVRIEKYNGEDVKFYIDDYK